MKKHAKPPDFERYKNQKCTCCGISNDTGYAFKQRQRHTLSRKRFIECPLCFEQNVAGNFSWSFYLVILTIGGVGLLNLWTSKFESGWLWVNTAAFQIIFVVLTIIQGYIRLLVANIVSYRIFSLGFGCGERTLLKGNFFGVSTHLHTLPLLSYIVASPTSKQQIHFKFLLVTSSGLIYSLSIFVSALFVFSSSNSMWGFSDLDRSMPVSKLFLFASFIILIISFSPYFIKTKWGEIVSPILELISYFHTGFKTDQGYVDYKLSERNQFEIYQARIDNDRVTEEQWIVKSITEQPDNLSYLFEHSQFLLQADPRKAYDQFTQLLKKIKSEPATNQQAQYYLKNAIAFTIFLLDDKKLIDQADRYSKEALSALKDEISVNVTRGAILLKLGNIENGLALLYQSENRLQETSGLLAGVISIGEALRSNLDLSEQYYQTAKADNAYPALLKIAQRTIGDQYVLKNESTKI